MPAVPGSNHVQAHTAARVAKAGELFDTLAELEDPKAALRLLSAGAGFSRMVNSYVQLSKHAVSSPLP